MFLRIINLIWMKYLFVLMLVIPAFSCSSSASLSGGADPIVISWVAPSLREDNTALSLSEIAGFWVYYSQIEGQYDDRFFVDSCQCSDEKVQLDTANTGVSSIEPGTYFAVMTTVDTDGRESQYSDFIEIDI